MPLVGVSSYHSSSPSALFDPEPIPTAVPSPLFSFSRERIRDCWDEAQVLARANHEETGAVRRGRFAPDQARYVAFDDAGTLRLFTVRAGRTLVGYAVMFTSPHLDYPDDRFAMQLALFVVREARGPMVLGYLRWQDEQLRQDGNTVVYRHSTVHKPYGKVLARLGYQAHEVGFIRNLREVA